MKANPYQCAVPAPRAERRLSRLRLSGLILGFALWMATVSGGFYLATERDRLPGTTGRADGEWPPESRLGAPAGVLRLVLFLHPHCPCTPDNLDALERVVRLAGPNLWTRVVFWKPAGAAPGWEASPTWDRAAALAPAAYLDAGGAETYRFGAVRSGEAVLFDGGGAIRFRGGLAGRGGHGGDDSGMDVLLGALLAPSGTPATSPVFGCPFYPAETPR